jgi:hypothetical protein
MLGMRLIRGDLRWDDSQAPVAERTWHPMVDFQPRLSKGLATLDNVIMRTAGGWH